ncbi:MAG: asparagine synthase-related protein [Candidatus Aenigmarchaeota archaeon]|nr:asparagine synthase-related protein [Candidatus Aenigmarchaeota archaeon]
MEGIKEKLLKEIFLVIEKSCKEKEVGIAFSGGCDSSLLAKACEKLGKEVKLLTVGLENCSDLKDSKISSKALNLPHFIKALTLDELETGIKKVNELTKPKTLIDLEIRVGFYFIFLLAKENNIKTVLSANGLDELFCGYKRCCKFLRISEQALIDFMEKTVEKALENQEAIKKIGSFFGINYYEPFLDKKFIEFSKGVPLEFKIKTPDDNLRKHITREIAFNLGLPKEIAFRIKKSFQYSSGIHKGIEKLGRKHFTKIQAKKLGFKGIREAYFNLLSSGQNFKNNSSS